MNFKEVGHLLIRTTTGKIGVIFFLSLIAISFYVGFSYPGNFGRDIWGNPEYWADNPKSAPPSWSNFISSERLAKHSVLMTSKPSEINELESQRIDTFRLPVNLYEEEFPTFLSLSFSNVEYSKTPPIISVFLKRPDGSSPLLYRHIPPGPRPGENNPFLRYNISPMRVVLNNDPNVINNLTKLHNRTNDLELSAKDIGSDGIYATFGTIEESHPKGFALLNGPYEFIIEVLHKDKSGTLGSIKLVVGGSVYGVMGTDSLGRDLAVGLLFGFPVALIIGILASTLTTGIGTFLGILSGYHGGWIDTCIQRVSDVVANIPVLPILIFLVFIFGSNLFMIILILVAFSWPSLTILIRSMVLQIRTGQIIEASQVLGASNRWIMLRHIFPQTAPFVFAQMIFFTPAAILAEAGLSFLGLGDPSIPTWGQILEQGFRTGAVYQGYWWWILPPGLLIVITALTFALLALALEPVINPKLRDS